MKKLAILIILMAAMTACKSGTGTQSENPFFSEWNNPYGVPPFDKIKAEHFAPAYESAFRAHNAEIEAIVNEVETPTFENTILAFDNAGQDLERVALMFWNLMGAESSDELLKAAEGISARESEHSDSILMNTALFSRVHSVWEKRGELDPLQSRLTDNIHKRFVRSGAQLSADKMEQLRRINSALAAATLKFSNNMLAENARFEMVLEESDLEGLPSNIRSEASAAAKAKGYNDKYLFTISKGSMLPFLTYSTRRDLRERIYRGYFEKCNYGDSIDNKSVINDIVRLRTEKAHLLGFATHADFVLDERMAKTTKNVYSLLDDLWTPALEKSKEELAEMIAIKGDDDFKSWDWDFYAEKVRKSKYNLDSEQIRPYFSMPNVQRGVFELINRLFGLTFRPVTNVPVYSPDCATFEVLDVDGSSLGILIADYYARPSKQSGAWCSSYREARYVDGERVLPIVTVVFNFPRPASNSRPSLLSLDDTETFFHEMGHAIHAHFTDVPYVGLSNTERDFVELPSQILENWAFEPELLNSYAVHYQNSRVIPADYVKRINAASKFNQGFATLEYLAASYIDMDIYSIKEYETIDVNAFERAALYEKRKMIEQIQPRYRYPYFSHIFDGGYSAGYYSYIWAEVLDKDAFAAFVESGDIFSRHIATQFRNEILSKGGAADGMTLYHNFRHAEPKREPLLISRGLIDEPEIVVEEPKESQEAIW